MNYDLAMKRRRRGSLPVASMRRRGSADHHKDLRKLLDKRSDELLQQRQQYRIFENRFKQEELRCRRLEQDTERLKQLLVDLLSIHSRYHRSYMFPCSKVTGVVISVLIALTIIGIIVFHINEIRFQQSLPQGNVSNSFSCFPLPKTERLLEKCDKEEFFEEFLALRLSKNSFNFPSSLSSPYYMI